MDSSSPPTTAPPLKPPPSPPLPPSPPKSDSNSNSSSTNNTNNNTITATNFFPPPTSASPPPPPLKSLTSPPPPPPLEPAPPPIKTSSPPPPSSSPPPITPLSTTPPTPSPPPPIGALTTPPPAPSTLSTPTISPPTPPDTHPPPNPPSAQGKDNNIAPPVVAAEHSPPPPPSTSGLLLPPPSQETTVPIANPPPSIRQKPPSTPNVPAIPPSSSSSSSTLVIGVGIGAVLIAFIALAIFCASKRPKRNVKQYHTDHHSKVEPNGSGQKHNRQDPSHVMEMVGGRTSGEMAPTSPRPMGGFNKSTFSYDELAAATNGFSDANLLGQGGFGYVHKGMLPNGIAIAVKSLKSDSGQGEREFQAEVDIISRVHHRHLVSLVGYCIAQGRRMLVYEFVPNKTMEYHLHQAHPPFDWSTRLRIALGSAKGLAYLHEDCHPRIIHRDIKAANILIDHKYEAMVADFGLAKLTTDNYTHVSTRVMGTFGYLAPEYASSGKLTEKSDVFSFGVMLLELITGRKPVDTTNTNMEDSLVDWARPIMTRSLEEKNFEELADPRLGGKYNPKEISSMVDCAAASVRHSAKRRPKMSQIVRALEGGMLMDEVNEREKTGARSSSGYDTEMYNADMVKFRKVAFSSQEFGCSDYTSDYSQNISTSSSANSRRLL